MFCWFAYDAALDQAGGFHADSFFSTLAIMLGALFGGGALMLLLMTGFTIWRGAGEAVRGPFRLALSDEGVTRETTTQRLLVKWRGIYRVRIDRWYLRIYLTPSAYFLVPRRAFILEQDVDNFYRAAKAGCEAAKPAKPPKPARD